MRTAPFVPHFDIKLHSAQAQIFHDNSRFRVGVCGRRMGKTYVAIACILEQALKRPNQLIWYVAPTYRMAKDIMWSDPTGLKETIPPEYIRKTNETSLSITLKNGTQIQLKGCDKPDQLRGRGVHFVVLDEFQDFKDLIWEKVIYPTLTSTKGKALILGTPKQYNNLYKLYTLGQDPKFQKQGWKSWQFPTIVNPLLDPREIEMARSNLDEKTFEQEFLASFTSMQGRVYYPFDRFIHCGEFNFDPRKPIWVGQDFNVDPMCSVIIQPQESGELWVVDEVHMNNSSTQELSEELDRRFFKPQVKRLVEIYPDASGGNRSSSRGESDLKILRDSGFNRIYNRKKNPDVIDRINAVNRMLRDANGQVKLRINRKCSKLIDSLEQTLYEEGSRKVDKKSGKEHMTDALGYPIEYRFPVKRVGKYYGVSY
jgi:hypothetical protein